MGLCTSKANRNIPPHSQYTPMKPHSSLKKSRSSTFSVISKDFDLDFRVTIVEAYIHHIQQLFNYYDRDLSNTHQSIMDLIVAYYPKYYIYGLNVNDIDTNNNNIKFKRLEKFEKVLLDTNNILNGNDRFYIKDVMDDLHCWNGFSYSHNTGNNEIITKDNDLFEISSIELTRNSYSSQLNKWIQFNPELKKKHKKFTIKITQIECGKSHVLLLSSKGTVHSMGVNYNGECGITQYQATVSQPTLIEEFISKGCNIKSISCGDYHSCCVEGRKNLNLVWTFGKNDYKQCDVQKERNILIPIVHQAFKISNIIKGQCGSDFTVVLDDRGSLKTFGNILIEYDDKKLMESNTSINDFSVGNDHVILINDQYKISFVKPRIDNETPERSTVLVNTDNISFPGLPLLDMIPESNKLNSNLSSPNKSPQLVKMVTASHHSILVFSDV